MIRAEPKSIPKNRWRFHLHCHAGCRGDRCHIGHREGRKKDGGIVKDAAKVAAVGAILPGVGVATRAAVGAVSGGV